MVKPIATVRFAISLVLISCLHLMASAQESSLKPVSSKYAITNATIIQGPGRVIQNGTILFDDGIIKSVGTNVTVPADAQIIKGDSMFVYAGFISGMSNIGVPKPKESRSELDRTLRHDPPYEEAGITPQRNVVEQISIKDKSLEEYKALGFTSVVTAPYGGMMPGRSALILTNGDNADGMVIKNEYSLFSQLEGANRMYPATVIGVMAKYRDMYRNAELAKAYLSQYQSTGTGMERPERDLTIESLFPVVGKQMPVSFKAENILDVHRVLTLQRELGFKLQLVDVKQGWDAMNEIKKAQADVFLSLEMPEVKKEEKKKSDKEEDESKESEEEKPKTALDLEKEQLEKRKQEMLDRHYAQAGVFASNGVTFGFSTIGVKSKDVKGNLMKMVEKGLTTDQALAALTTSPAQLLGVSKLMGTLDAGKMANIVVTDKPFLEEKANVRFVFVDGEMSKYEPKKEQKDKGKKDDKQSKPE